MPRHRVAIYGIALALSTVVKLVSYYPFLWLFVGYETWYPGHPNPFDIGSLAYARSCSLLAAQSRFG